MFLSCRWHDSVIMAENKSATDVSYEFTYNILYIIISIIGATSNILLLVAFIKDPLKCFRNSGTYLVMNLSVSDCLECLMVASSSSLTVTKIPKPASQVIEFLEYWYAGVSFISVTAISIDRFLMVGYPIKHHISMKGKLIILWLATIWIGSCLFTVLSLICFHTNGKNIGYIFSVIVMILSAVMYSSTYYKLKKRSRNIALQNSTESRAQGIRTLKEKRFLNTIILIACVALSCVVPHMIFSVSNNLLNFPKDKLTSELIQATTVFIFYVNFAVNPLIYILRLPNYRKTFYLLYCRRRTASS